MGCGGSGLWSSIGRLSAWLALALAFISPSAPPAQAEEALTASRYLSVRSPPGKPFGPEFRALVESRGSRIGRIVDVPEAAGGGQIASVMRPADEAAFAARLRALVGEDGFVEHDSCREFLPREPFPQLPRWPENLGGGVGASLEELLGSLERMPGGNDARVLVTRPAPRVEAFVAGETLPWDPAPPLFAPAAQASRLRVDRTLLEGGWEILVGVGWNSERTRGPGEKPPGDGAGVPVPPPGGGPKVPVDESPPPVTSVPEEERLCRKPETKPASGPGIQLGVRHGAPETFPYPRPLPLQAVARDYDQLLIRCKGCGGGSREERFLEDRVVRYQWRIVEGPGSLNRPYRDVEDLAKIEKEIEKLRRKIRDLSEEIARLEEERARKRQDRDRRRTEIRVRIERLKQERDQARNQILERLDPEIGELERRRQEAEQRRDAARKEIEAIEKQITEHRQEIAQLEGKLRGESSSEERALQEKIEAQKREIESLRAAYADLQKRHARREAELSRSYDAALLELAQARRALQQVRTQVRASQDRILDLENRLYNVPAWRELMQNRAEVERVARDIARRYAPELGADPARAIGDAAEAMVRAASPSARQAARQRFDRERTRLLEQVRSGCRGVSGCLSRVRELEAGLQRLASTLDRIADRGLVDTRVQRQLEEERKRLAALERQVRQAEARVDAAEKEVGRAQKAYADGLEAMAQESEALEEKIRRAEARKGALEAQLDEAHKRAEQERLAKKPEWLQRIDDLRGEIDRLRAEIADRRAAAERAQKEMDALDAELAKKRAERRSLEELADYKDQQIAREEARLQALEQEDAGLASAIDKKKQERRRLEAKLRAREKGLEKKMDTAQKAATGQQVYYIPPPLELVPSFEKKRFGQLKEEVASAEAELEKRRGEKAQLQDRAFDLLRRMNEGLWVLRTAAEALEAVEEQIAELQAERDNRKLEKAHERTQRASSLLKQAARAEARAKEYDRAYIEAVKEVRRRLQEVNESRRAVQEALSEVERLQSRLNAQIEKIESLKHRVQNAETELARARTELDRLVSDLRKAEEAHSRALNAASRADALGDSKAAARERSRAKTLRKRVDELGKEIGSRRQRVQALAKALEEEQKRLESAHARFRELRRELHRKRREAEQRIWEHREKVVLLDTALEFKRKMDRQRKEAEAEAKRLRKEAEAVRASVKKLGEEPDIQALQAKLDELEKKKKDREAQVEKARIALESLAEARKKWRKDRDAADERIREAEERLSDARGRLKSFLHEQFRKVRFKVVIEVKAADAPMFWRAKDPEGRATITIRFEGDRKPIVTAPRLKPVPLKTRHVQGACDVAVSFNKAEKLGKVKGPALDGREPQTIALFYKQGQPLYELWPPRKDTREVLAYSAAPAVVGVADTDKVTVTCAVGKGSACKSSPPDPKDIPDATHVEWATRTHTSKKEERTMLDVPPVPKNQCSAKERIGLVYTDSSLQFAESGKEKFTYDRIAGLLGDAPEEYSDFDRDDRVRLRVQLFEGAHRGLPGEKIEWEVTSHAPETLSDADFGFEGGGRKITRTTDGSGYSKVDFHLKARFGEVKIAVRWLRGKQACKTMEITVRRLLRLRPLYAGMAPVGGWEQAERMWSGNDDYDALAKALPEDGQERKPLFAAGLVDDQFSPVDGRKLRFSLASGGSGGMSPASRETAIYGFAWSFADADGEEDLAMEAEVEPPAEKYTRPGKVRGEASTRTIREFLIGPGPGRYLTIGTETPFAPGEPYSGEAHLVIRKQGIPASFRTLKLTAEEVVVEERDGGYVAVSGSVSWSTESAGGKPFAFEKAGFRFSLETLGLTAGNDGRLTGKLHLPGKDEEVGFIAVIGPGGFYGEADNFPEIAFAGMKLQQGASVVVDMHDQEDPPDPVRGWSGRGLLVREASLMLPEALKGRRDTPPVIGVKGFFFNSAGLTGEISLDYTVSAGMGKVSFAIDHVEIALRQNELTKAAFKGKASFPDPFEGDVAVSLYLDNEGNFTIEAGTDNPISAPRFGLTFQLRKLAAKYEKKVFTFTISADLKSETFSDISIKGFEINSEGEVKAEEIAVNKDVTLGPGFSSHLVSFGFVKTKKDYALTLRTRFQFGEMLEAEQADVRISAGPRIEEFALSIKGRRRPVSFSSTVHYKADVFAGDLQLEVENVMNVHGSFVMGTRQLTGGDYFTYWYIELASSTSIPLAQTGLVINEIGGGVGYNYEPPIGRSGGAVVHSRSFAFKASVGLGNAPKGEVFSGRLTMVLVSDRFSLNGKVWLLERDESLYGEGQLDLYWRNPARLEGYVAMLVALPDAGGKLLRFNGQVDFLFAGRNKWHVRSRELKGAVLERVIADGRIDIRPQRANLKGTVRYDLARSVGVRAISLKVEVHLRADGSLEFRVTPEKVVLDTRASFHGSMDADLVTAVKTFNIFSGALTSSLRLRAENLNVAVEGKVRISWDTWVHSGSTQVDIGYSM